MKKPRLTVAFVLVALLGLPAISHAREATEAGALINQLSVLRKAGNPAALLDVLEEVPQVYRRTGDASEQSKLRKEVGKIAKQRDLGPARVAAVRAAAALGDPKRAWDEISSLLPGASKAEPSDLDLAVVMAAGKLAQGKVAKPLLNLVVKAKDPRLSATAAEALAGFHSAPKTRVVVLKELVAIGTRLAARADAGGEANAIAVERWSTIGPALVRGLNGLTGQELTSFADWQALYEKHRSTLDQVFEGGEE